jgi:hypothetical protein
VAESWKDHNCVAMRTHYTVYSIPHAAALWCGVTDEFIDQVLAEVTQLSDSGFGRGVWKHPEVPCLEPRSRAMAEAIENGLLPHGRESAEPVEKNDRVAPDRRHIFGRNLKIWMEEAFPNEKPAFLFDDIERDSHTSISADSYRTLQAERDALKSRIEKAIESYSLLRNEKIAIEADRDSLKKKLEGVSLPNEDADHSALLKSVYWGKLGALADHAIEAYPSWKDKQRIVQKTGNLQTWLTTVIKADNREAETIKKILSDFFQELR